MRQFQLAAEIRRETGKGVNNRLRRSGYIPAVVYGSGKENVNVQVEERLVGRLMRQGGLNRLLTLQIDGQDKAVLVQEVQVHPVRGSLQHIDFLEVRLDEKVTVTVPIQIVGDAPGVQEGGVLTQSLWELEVSCLPTDIPDALEIDISGLAIGDTLLVKDIQAQEGVEITADPEETVLSIAVPQAVVDEADEAVEGEAAGEGADEGAQQAGAEEPAE
ncbi:MAG: 50S ribosomal protein L25/general stress protein Ctc [Firmicutes bacterium]|jgi:large subunit ribosomal protein L25|nr:50S ribosomal protein L25/general stress protein Ctc [Bacillota bacterium]